jgi:hypothetical protein
MKTSVVLFLLFAAACCFNACDSCSFDGESYNWEKRDYKFGVPFSLDSLSSDTLNIRFYSFGGFASDAEVIYSSQLDTFAITVDVQGENYQKKTEEDSWKPYYKYYWTKQELVINFQNDYFKTRGNFSQNPQCTPALSDVLSVTKLKVEVPAKLRHVNIYYEAY